MSQLLQNSRSIQNIGKLFFGKIIVISLFVLAVIAVSGCSGNCNAGGNTYGGKVLCKALDF